MENIIKHAGGRPSIWTDPEELQVLIDDYFASITRKVDRKEPVQVGFDDKGKPVFEDQPVLDSYGRAAQKLEWLETPTLSGLAIKLGVDRTTLINYAKDEKFFNTLKSAKSIIERYNESRLDERANAVGTIFNLKNNFGWKDTTEIGITGSLQTTNYDISEMDPSDKASLLAILSKLTEKTAADQDEITG